MEIHPTVTAIDVSGFGVNWAFLVRGEEIAIIDTGTIDSPQQHIFPSLKKLEMSASDVQLVLNTHVHFDHTGGLSHFLNENGNVTLHTPSSFRGVLYAKEVREYDKPLEIYPGYYTTGELDSLEQSLAVDTGNGLLIVAGCSHPAMYKTLAAITQFGSIYGILGGLHGFEQYDLFKDFQIICPTHCTQHIEEIEERFPEKYIKGGAGKVISVSQE